MSTERSRHLGPLIALGLAAVLGIAAVVVAIVGGDDVSATAVRVNTAEVSQKTFNSQLGQLSKSLRAQGAPADVAGTSSVSSSAAAQLAQLYVVRQLLTGVVDVSAADRRELVDANQSELATYSPEIRKLVVDVAALQRTLSDERGAAGASRLLGRLARRADITVDPRYGFWNPASASVCAPTGCASSTAGG